MDRTTGRAAYRAVRDILVRHRDDYDAAVATFRWPEIGTRFNWALDWFDGVAATNPRTALRIIGEDGTDRSYSFAEMAARSDRLATSLAAGGVAPGHRVMVMLGNQVELWESMLAVMKLGAVVMPATTALGPKDVADRVGRGAVRHVITNADQVDKFADIPGDFGRIAIGDATPPWRLYRLADAVALPSRLITQTRADDPMLIYFTSGTTSQPKLVEHTHRSYPVGHLSTMYFLGLRPGDVHLNISSPGWAKHAWSSFFAPWIAEATILVYNYTPFRRIPLPDDAAAGRRHLRVRATDGVAHAHSGQSGIQAAHAARGGRCGRTAEPRSHRACPKALGSDHPRRVRADGDHGVDWQYSGFTGQARLDGAAAARCCGGDRRPGERAARQRG